MRGMDKQSRNRRTVLVQTATLALATPAISATAQTQPTMTPPAEPSDAMRSPATTCTAVIETLKLPISSR